MKMFFTTLITLSLLILSAYILFVDDLLVSHVDRSVEQRIGLQGQRACFDDEWHGCQFNSRFGVVGFACLPHRLESRDIGIVATVMGGRVTFQDTPEYNRQDPIKADED